MTSRGLMLSAALLCAAPLALGGCARDQSMDVMAMAKGTGPGDAWPVRDAGIKYRIVAAHDFVPESQSLLMRDGRAYDVITARRLDTGEYRTFWFDIGSATRDY